MDAMHRFAQGYNERLFAGGLRKWLHEARFRWLNSELEKRSVIEAAIVELGCFDCRTLRYIPRGYKTYRGFDADWEGGLTLATARVTDSRVSLHRCQALSDFKIGPCNIVISLETMEHLAPNDLPGYLREIAQNLSAHGVALLSIPNETGPIFLAKQIYKAFFLEGARDYTLAETLFQTLGMVSLIERREHKGFSWRRFVDELNLFLQVERVSGVQVRFLPSFLNPSIGIVATKRRA
jgi:2-polyprenyl-3-methyl-5-hydroxy-6-metoxy-1,4-benzoquinol methylase